MNNISTCFICILWIFTFSIDSECQTITGIVNSYHKVIKISTCPNEIEVNNNEGLEIGSKVLIIQMQGALIDSSNSATFGRVLQMNSAGKHEFGMVRSIIGNRIIFENRLLNTYQIEGSVQLVRIPVYNNATIINTLFAKPWDGETGGIVALEIEKTLTLNGIINANNRGFRGGASSVDFYNINLCTFSDYVYPADIGASGLKGESISKLRTQIAAGRGANANGGGGGNYVNSGGGGGGHLSRGGQGGDEWNSCSDNSIGGVGGLILNRDSNRIFLGGGGGGGQQNNAVGTNGGNGGGIVIIKAGNIIVQTSGAIQASGESVSIVAGNDGAGGGGAGGTVIIQTETISGNRLPIELRGGRGGDMLEVSPGPTCHGPGGGGSGGVLYLSSNTLQNAIQPFLNPGSSGVNVTPNLPCTNQPRGATAGQPGQIIIGKPLTENLGNYNAPTFSLIAQDPTCAGISNGKISLTPILGRLPFSYQWNPSIGSSSQASNLPAGDYIISVTDADGCKLDSLVTLIEPENLYIRTSPVPALICRGDSVLLNASGALNYQWSHNKPNGSMLVLDTSASFFVVGTNSNGCTSDTAFINVNVPRIQLTTSAPTVCTNQSITLQASGTHNITWTQGITNGIPFTPSSSNIYIATGFFANGCIDTLSTTVEVVDKPNAIISGNLSGCIGTTLTLSAVGDYQFLWSNGSSSRNTQWILNQNTQVALIASLGTCRDTTFTYLTVLPNPLFTVNPQDTTIMAGNTIPIQTTDSLSYTYTWSPANFLNCQNCSTAVATPDRDITYTITASSSDGCESTRQVVIRVIQPTFQLYVPTAFTPNNDGLNDIFRLAPDNANFQFSLIKFNIYNRWGQLLFQTNNIGLGWDGSYKGLRQPTGTYIYQIIIKRESSEELINMNGSFTLIR
jgi:gliding motility-associated-like protein